MAVFVGDDDEDEGDDDSDDDDDRSEWSQTYIEDTRWREDINFMFKWDIVLATRT